MIAKTLGVIAGQTATHMHHAKNTTPTKHIFRLQYASNLPHTLSVQTLGETLVPVAKTLVLLGSIPDPEVVVECGNQWQNVLYAPFCTPTAPLHNWPKNVHILHMNHKPFHYLPKDNVGFILADNAHLRTELYHKWTYRGASVVLLSQERLGPVPLSHYASRSPLAVFANAAASCNLTDYHTLSVSNPATLYNGQRVRNYDKKAFAEFLVKDEKECAVDYDLARSAAALRVISLK
jgi:hypothetical protein